MVFQNFFLKYTLRCLHSFLAYNGWMFHLYENEIKIARTVMSSMYKTGIYENWLFHFPNRGGSLPTGPASVYYYELFLVEYSFRRNKRLCKLNIFTAEIPKPQVMVGKFHIISWKYLFHFYVWMKKWNFFFL